MIQGLSGPISRIEKIGLIVGLLLASVLMWPLRNYVTDDTYIHLQYARHLASGRGLVFNDGERVYGCTSPLWVALLADGMALGLDGLGLARWLGGLSTLASVVLFLQLMRRTVTTPSIRAAATVAWSGHAWMLRWSQSGMETSLAVTLVLAGFVAFTEGQSWGSRPVRTAALWSLAALTRPEAVVLILLWGVFLLIDTENREGLRRLVAGALPPAIIYGGWLLFARLYFGTFWPQTLVAKAAGSTTLAFHADNAWRELRVLGATDGALIAALGLALVLGGSAVWSRAPSAQRLVPWVWVAALPALYLARGVPVLSRYTLPLSPILAWLSWRACERWWLGHDPNPAAVRRAGVWATVLMLVVLLQNAWVYRVAVVPQVQSFSAALESSLVNWGRWFREHTPQQAVIAAPDIGAIGYFSERRVVDLAGLITPEMVPLLARETQEEVVSAFRFAAFSRPDYLVDRAPEAYALAASSPYGASLVPLGTSVVPNLGIARPDPVTYTFYRIDWATFDSLRAARPRAAMLQQEPHAR